VLSHVLRHHERPVESGEVDGVQVVPIASDHHGWTDEPGHVLGSIIDGDHHARVVARRAGVLGVEHLTQTLGMPRAEIDRTEQPLCAEVRAP